MRTISTDAVGVLSWGVRRYRVLFLALLILGGALLPFAVLRQETPAEAKALIIGQRLDMDLEALPRYGEAVFEYGEVARAVATAFPDLADEEDLIPGRVYVLAEQDSLVLTVVARDVDPKAAADIANVAADAYVGALNSGGAGIGLFRIQNRAEPPPVDEDSGLSTPVTVAVGLVGGLVLGLAAVSALLVARRPVIDASDAAETTGVPALGLVAVPRTQRGSFAAPEDFVGLVPVCRRLLTLPTSTVVVVGEPQQHRIREQLSVAMASVIMRVRDVRFIGPDGARAVLADRKATAPPRDARELERPGAHHLTLVDSIEPLDLVQPPQDTVTILVAHVGVRSAALREAVVEHLGGSAEARILMVKWGRRARAREAPRHDAAPRSKRLETAAPGGAAT